MYLYGMQTKLTLRVDDELVKQAKSEASQRGKSVSQMFGDFVRSLESSPNRPDFPPVTTSLRGILKGKNLSVEDYKTHLREKHG